MTATVDGVAGCTNCGARLTGRYCAQCGQAVAATDPTLRDVLHETIPELINVDGKVLRSIRQLFIRPGFLTREIFAGRRASYVAPIRLYLVCSVLFFAITAFVERPVFEASDEVEIGPIGQILGLGKMSVAEANSLIGRASTEWTPRVMFVLVPMAALLVQLVTLRTRRHYPQHLYFALHVHAACFGVLALYAAIESLGIAGVTGTAYILRTVFILGYTVIAFRTAYGGGWALATSRTFVVLFLYTNILTAALLAILAISMRR